MKKEDKGSDAFPLIKSLLGLELRCSSYVGWTVDAEALERLLEKSVRVYGEKPINETYWSDKPDPLDDTHTGLLIDIKPIAKPDTAESLLRELVEIRTDDLPTADRLFKLTERAKKLLGEK